MTHNLPIILSRHHVAHTTLYVLYIHKPIDRMGHVPMTLAVSIPAHVTTRHGMACMSRNPTERTMSVPIIYNRISCYTHKPVINPMQQVPVSTLENGSLTATRRAKWMEDASSDPWSTTTKATLQSAALAAAAAFEEGGPRAAGVRTGKSTKEMPADTVMDPTSVSLQLKRPEEWQCAGCLGVI